MMRWASDVYERIARFGSGTMLNVQQDGPLIEEIALLHFTCSFGGRDSNETGRASSVPSQNCAHPALNALAAGPLTATYSRLTKNPRANPERSMEVFTRLTSWHFNLFTLLQQRYTLQTLVYQGCSTLHGMRCDDTTPPPQTLAMRHSKAARTGDERSGPRYAPERTRWTRREARRNTRQTRSMGTGVSGALRAAQNSKQVSNPLRRAEKASRTEPDVREIALKHT
jgi:hypothetical protein